MASPDYSDGCMIALYPPAELAAELTVDGGLPPEDLHVTVVYCGDAIDVDAEAFRQTVEDLAAREPVTATISGLARFTGGDKDVLVALVDSAALEDLRRDAMDALIEQGIKVPRDHGYTAHCTLTYLDPDEPAPLDRLAAVDTQFGALAAVHGTDRTDSLFEHPMAAPAREAFAAGWALSGGPMTERVRAASMAAVRAACESADEPGTLTATIDLGRAEGMWALLFQRRTDQQNHHADAIQKAWSELISRDAVAIAVDVLRRETGLEEAADRRSIRNAAQAAARSLLNAVVRLSGWGRLRGLLREALVAGRAEGMVAAVAVAADQAGRIGLDWNIAFEDAYRSLGRLDDLWSGIDPDGWLARTVDRATTDLGRVLADTAEQGATRDEMIDAAMDVLTAGTDRDAVAFTVDWAMTTAADQGALALYATEGVTAADWITAGDGRVCETCAGNEDRNPWPPTAFPPMPSHPGCRCVPAAAVDLAHFTTWFT